MGSKVSIAWKVAGVAALVASAAVVGGAGSASAGQATGVSGVATCDAETGQAIITWTFINGFNSSVDINSNLVDDTGLVTGNVIDTTAFSPTNLEVIQDTSVAVTHASPDATGDVTMTVTYAPFDSSASTVSDTVTLVGCVAPTTTVAPTTAAPTTVAPVTTALAAGGGSLPASGNDSTLPILAGLMVATGGGLLLLRRRTVTN